MMKTTCLVVLALLSTAGTLPATAQDQNSGPNPADQTVIRPGKLIGAPKEAGPATGSGDPTTTAPGVKPMPPGGASAGGLTPPQPLSASTGLRIVRWATFRRITRYQQADLKYFAQVKMSADGSKIAFATVQGTFVINSDGTNQVQLSDKGNANPGVVDITADGKKVVWTDADQRALYVASSDGSARQALPIMTTVVSARITADGSRVFALSPDGGGILSVATDGSAAHPLVTTAAVCKLLGTGENGNHWRGWPSGLDISDDGSRVVFHLLWDAFGINGDGTNLRQLTQYMTPEDRNMNFVRISGNGKRVATYHQQKGITLQDWDGGNVVTHGGTFPADVRWMQLSDDGTKLAASGGLRLFDANGLGQIDLGDWGSHGGDHPMADASGASISADGRRMCVMVRDQGLQELEVIDIDSASLDGVPTVSAITVKPLTITPDGSKVALATAKVSGQEIAAVGIAGLRDGFNMPEWYLRPWGGMNDEGKSGDVTAGDGVFSTGDVRLFKPTPNDAAPGPITLRFFAWNKQKNALVVDVEGFETRSP